MTVLALTVGFFACLQLQQWLHNKRVDKLLDRIQAPEKVIHRDVPAGPMPEAVHPMADADYWDKYGVPDVQDVEVAS